ncbi:MAG TPA: imidazolonepropionase [Flavobacteriales bacterium]
MKLFIKNIKGLVGVYDDAPQFVSGKEMQNLPVLEDAWLAVEDGIIADYGLMKDWPGITDWRDLEVIDASGKYIFPSWVDSHTHTVYAGSREGEFVDRIHGLSYEEIAARGGGIINSAARLAKASEQELYGAAYERLNEMMRLGTGAVEIKSGYGLSLEAELKMLRVIKQLQENHPLTIKATFLGAHAYPVDYKNRPAEYVDMLIKEAIPAVAAEGLAEFIDVFCEKNYFSVVDTERILEAGVKHGLIPKTHVNQFNVIGGVAVSVKYNALSVDHLELVSDEDIEVLKASQTMPVALPGCSFFIRIPYTPARKIIDAGLPLAVATDFNPGTAPSSNMNLMVSLACINMGMTPEEAIHAATLNGAYAMKLSEKNGSISRGKDASFFITKEMPSLAFVPYSFGHNLIEQVFIKGIER